MKGVAEIAAVMVGGAVGTTLRLSIDAALPHGNTGFPVSTLIINTLGAFALGMLVAWVWPKASSWLRAGLGAGMLGSFTTFSAVAVSLVALATSGQWMFVVIYLLATLVLGLGAAWLGLRLGGLRAGPIDEVNE